MLTQNVYATLRCHGSLFVLEVRTGKDVSQLSSFPYEEEVLMGLNSMWLVISCYTVTPVLLKIFCSEGSSFWLRRWVHQLG